MTTSNRHNRPCGMLVPEFVLLVGFGIALSAISVEMLLPALPYISASFELENASDIQSIVVLCLMGMGVSQLIFGPLSDSFGRKPVMLSGLAMYIIASVIATITDSYIVMLIARFFQGMGAGATRVIAVSMARDTYEGNQLGRTMARVSMVWVLVPLTIPFFGQAVVAHFSWRWLFAVLIAAGVGFFIWCLCRYRESLIEQNRRPISLPNIFRGYKIVFTTRASMLYLLATTMLFSSHLSFVISSPAIIMDVFGEKDRFAFWFVLISVPMAIAALLNSQLVMRFGMSRLVCAGFTALTIQNGLHLAMIMLGLESLNLFVVIQMANVFAFGFITSSLSALTMQPVGHVAGTASSLTGFLPTCCGALIGSFTAQSISGSSLPLTLVYLGLGSASLLITSVERKLSAN